MAVRQSWGSFFGLGGRSTGGVRPYDKKTTGQLKLGAQNLSRSDRQRFLGMLKEEGKWHKTLSNKQVLDLMKQRGDPRAYRQRVKTDALMKRPDTGPDPKQVAKNIRLTIFDRLKDETKFGRANPAARHGLASLKQGQTGSAAAVRPDVVRPSRSKESQLDIHRPV